MSKNFPLIGGTRNVAGGDGMTMRNWMSTPRRADDVTASRWRGPLFLDWAPSIWWREPEPGQAYAVRRTIEPPGSVTFPICAWCRHVIWDWPHFAEETPGNAVCDACGEEEAEQQRREDDWFNGRSGQ
jgi:hypothetical protein